MIDYFSRVSRRISLWIGHPYAFVIAVLGTLLWAAFGPSAGYSASWQLVINTGTTILTFLILFIIQNSQNRDSQAIQLKLDELLRAIRGARNEMIELENLNEAEISRYVKEFHELHARYVRDARAAEHKTTTPPAGA